MTDGENVKVRILCAEDIWTFEVIPLTGTINQSLRISSKKAHLSRFLSFPPSPRIRLTYML